MNVVANDKIKQIMFKQNVTGVKMARVLGISQTSFYNKINDKRQFTAGEIGIMSAFLKTSPNFFYNLCYENSNNEHIRDIACCK